MSVRYMTKVEKERSYYDGRYADGGGGGGGDGGDGGDSDGDGNGDDTAMPKLTRSVSEPATTTR